eukprot:m.1126265 g.1126265  ORF g.1126265 m.1126265 type:complete len:706 (+) comp24411_c0_seq2:1745-3862(+)
MTRSVRYSGRWAAWSADDRRWQKIPLVLVYSAMGECSYCGGVTFYESQFLDNTTGHSLSTCKCQVKAQTKTSPTAVEAAAAPVISVGAAGGDTNTVCATDPSHDIDTVRVQIHCRNLGRTGDMVSALCIFLRRNPSSKLAADWVEVGQTELQYGQTSPTFSTIFDVDITPDVTSEIKVEVHIVNSIKGSVSKPTRESTMLGIGDLEPQFYGEAVFPVGCLHHALQHMGVNGDGVRSSTVRRPVVSSLSASSTVQLTLTTVCSAVAVDPFTTHILDLVRNTSGRKDAQEKLFSDYVTQMFADCSRESLNACLQALDNTTLPVLFGKKDRVNTSLICHLFRKRAADFDLPTKFNIINLTQQDASAREKQELIVVLFEATYGNDLFVLKDQIDVDNSTILNMSRLVFNVISDEALRSRLRTHLRKEAQLLVEFADSSFTRPLRILSDIDDTLVHSGYGLGGPKYSPGTILPGFVALIRVLEARVAFVTARPQFIQHFTYKTLRDRYGIPDAVCLSGELRDSVLIPIAKDYSNDKISTRKMGNIRKYMEVFAECRFAWFGDSGQGDILVGEQMLSDPELKPLVEGVYIQDVVESNGIGYRTDVRERERRKSCDGILVADNYLEVAVAMHKKGTLSSHGLQKMALTTAKQIRSLMLDPFNEEIMLARVFEHEKQLKVITAALQSDSGQAAASRKARPSLTPTATHTETRD